MTNHSYLSAAKNASLLSVTVILFLLLSEILLRYLTPFPISLTSNRVPHDELLYVLDPDSPDIDQLGFRNREGPQGKTIFATGDSHTYGENVVWDKSWPMQLQKMLGAKVYNFGVPSYNIYQYYKTFEISTQYNPKYMIVGLYPANDFVLYVCEILDLEYWKNKIIELGLSNNYCESNYNLKKSDRTINNILTQSVALISAFDYFIWDPIKFYFFKNQNDYLSISNGNVELKVNKNRAMSNSEMNNLRKLNVSEHFSNSQIIFKHMKERSERIGIKLLILIIPSKERVLVRWAKINNVEVPMLLSEAVKNQNSIIEKLLSFFSAHSIPASDATKRMVDLVSKDLSSGTQTYALGDGHPLAAGYSEYAKSILELFMDSSVRE